MAGILNSNPTHSFICMFSALLTIMENLERGRSCEAVKLTPFMQTRS